MQPQKKYHDIINGIKILLVDDHPLLRTGFSNLLTNSGEIGVVYDTDNPQDAYSKYIKLKPDVVVMDILFKDEMTGLDGIKQILKLNPQAAIVVLSQYDQPRLIKEVYQLGALAFIPKDAEPEVLIEAIKQAAIGEKYFLPDIAQKLAILTADKDEHPQTLLTDREFEVYKLIALDHSNPEIAAELGISLKAVTNALHTLKQKTRLKRNTEITKHALKHGVIKLED